MAKLLDPKSYAAANAELNLFSVPPTQVAVDYGDWQEVQVTGDIKQSGPYRFDIESNAFFYDLNKNFVCMTLKIVEDNGTDAGAVMAADVKVAPINLLAKTFFRQCVVKFGDQIIYDSNNLYAYQAYIETLLNYGKEAKKTQLQNAFFYKDTAGEFDQDSNQGFTNRMERLAGSKGLQIMAPIHCPVFMQERYMLPNTKISVELHRNDDKWLLQNFEATKQYKLVLDDMRWYVRKVKIQDSCSLAIENMLRTDNQMVRYPIRRVKMVSRKIEAPIGEVHKTGLFKGQIPRRIIFGLVSADAYNGDKLKSPVNFENFGIVEIKVTVDGIPFPQHRFKMNFEKDCYALPYEYLFQGSCISHEDRGSNISYSDFKDGNCLFVFDLTPDNAETGALPLVRYGDVDISFDFHPHQNPMPGELIVYGEFDNIISMNYNREVMPDYVI